MTYFQAQQDLEDIAMIGRKNHGGFTLIELVVVITILGILAAFAVPRFVSLETEARSAATQSLSGAVRSGAALAHALWLAQGSVAATVTMEGQSVAITNGYPTLASIASTLADTSGFTYTAGTGVWTKDGATTPANCSVTYAAPASAGLAPTVTVDVSVC
jgi:MSHA pilin protein MshA